MSWNGTSRWRQLLKSSGPYGLIGLLFVSAVLMAPSSSTQDGETDESYEPELALMISEARPAAGDIEILGVGPAETKVTLYEERSTHNWADIDLRPLDSSRADGESNLFWFTIPSSRTQAGEHGRTFWIKTQQLGEPQATNWTVVESTGTRLVDDDTTPPDEGPRTLSPAQFELLGYGHLESFDDPLPKLTLDRIDAITHTSSYLGKSTDGVVREGPTSNLYIWPLSTDETDSGTRLEMAVLRARKNEDGTWELARDDRLEFEATNPRPPQPVLRAGEDDEWTHRIDVETNPDGLGTFEYRHVESDGEHVAAPLQATADAEEPNHRFRPPLHPALFVAPPVITPDTDRVAVSAPDRKVSSVSSAHLGELADADPNPAANAPRLTGLRTPEGDTTSLRKPETTGESLEFDVDEAGEGLAHLLSVTDEVRVRRTLAAVEDVDDILGDDLETEHRQTRRALATLWGYLMDRVAWSGSHEVAVGVLEDATDLRSTRFQSGSRYRDLRRSDETALEQRNHLTSWPGGAGVGILAVLFGLLMALTLRQSDWRRLPDGRGPAHLREVAVSMAGCGALLGALGISAHLFLESGQTVSTVALVIVATSALITPLFVFPNRPVGSGYRDWAYRQVGLGLVAGLAAHYAATYSMNATLGLLALLALGTLATTTGLAVGLGRTDEDETSNEATEHELSRTLTGRRIDDPAKLVVRAVPFTTLPVVTALLVLW